MDPFTLGIAALGMAGGTSLLQFGQQRAAGKIAATEASVSAKQQELAAIQREADRKSDLVRAMASQTASAGSRGVAAFEGSPLSVLEADIEAEKTATERDIFNTRLGVMTTKARGQVAQKQATGRAIYGLATDTTKMAQTVPMTGSSGSSSSSTYKYHRADKLH